MLSYRRHADHLRPEFEIDHQPSDDRQLLGVLLAEHGHIGTNCAEELGDHGCHAPEVSGAVRALEAVGQPAGLDVGVEPVGVHRRRRRYVGGVHTESTAAAQVVADVAGVGVEVVTAVELQRVHEHRDHHQIAS